MQVNSRSLYMYAISLGSALITMHAEGETSLKCVELFFGVC